MTTGGIGGIGGISGFSTVGSLGGVSIATNPTGVQGMLDGASKQMGFVAEPSVTVSISQAGKSLLSADISQFTKGLSVFGNDAGLQVNPKVTGLDSGRLGDSVSAEITINWNTKGEPNSINSQSSDELNRLEDLLAQLIIAILMREQNKSDAVETVTLM
jgi:hypothetical protein